MYSLISVFLYCFLYHLSLASFSAKHCYKKMRIIFRKVLSFISHESLSAGSHKYERQYVCMCMGVKMAGVREILGASREWGSF